jgi:hypothetical protein
MRPNIILLFLMTLYSSFGCSSKIVMCQKNRIGIILRNQNENSFTCDVCTDRVYYMYDNREGPYDCKSIKQDTSINFIDQKLVSDCYYISNFVYMIRDSSILSIDSISLYRDGYWIKFICNPKRAGKTYLVVRTKDDFINDSLEIVVNDQKQLSFPCMAHIDSVVHAKFKKKTKVSKGL